MSPAELKPFMPFLILSAGALLVMLAIAFYRNHLLIFSLSVAVLAASLASLPWAARYLPGRASPLFIIDLFALFYFGLLIAAGIAVTLMAYPYLAKQAEEPGEEFYFLLLLATLGSGVLVASNHFATFLLGLEILSVSLYVLIGYRRTRERSTEAAIKYLILASVSAAFLFFGLALIYADLGTMDLTSIAQTAALRATAPGALLLAGLALAVVGIGFKLAVVPFHMWTPDVYEGAPAPATALVASVSKGGVFALMLRYFAQLGVDGQRAFFAIFFSIAVASMLVGNLLALRQNNIKRILAYSSIANLGYLLVAFLAGGPRALTAVAYYLVAYFAAILCAFGVVAALSGREEDMDQIADYKGLFWRRPWLAATFTAALFSLASIPLTAGFVGKFYVLAAGIGSALWFLVVTLVLTSGIGLYYYLRIIVAMTQDPEAHGRALPSPSWPGGLALAVLAIVLIWLGVYPATIVRLIEATAAQL